MSQNEQHHLARTSPHFVRWQPQRAMVCLAHRKHCMVCSGLHMVLASVRNRLDLAEWSHRDIPHRAADDQTLANHHSLFRLSLGRCPVAIGDFNLQHLVKGHARDKQPRNTKRPTENATSRRTPSGTPAAI